MIPAPNNGKNGNGASSCRRTRIKLCGVTNVEQVDLAIAIGIDALGLVFTAGLPCTVLPHSAMQITRRIPPFVSVIGVFSNPSDPELMVWTGRWVQLQGQEDEPQLQRVARLRSIIKGFPYDADQLRRWDRCAAVSAMMVMVPEAGASAEEVASVAGSLHTPIILGGALTPENVGQWIHAVRPHAVDFNVGTSQGGSAMIREFCQAVREADGGGSN